jgi:hypothetical protein
MGNSTALQQKRQHSHSAHSSSIRIARSPASTVPSDASVAPATQEQSASTARFGHSIARIPIFSPERKNETGLPDTLKARIEHLSGISLDNVRVHYNSSEPARIEGLAYTQGTDIHVGPGQQRHLPHEAWHVVQQKQGRVKPTLRLRDKAINDDQKLEQEAETMGAKAIEGVELPEKAGSIYHISPPSSDPIQGVFVFKGQMLARNSKEIRAVRAALEEGGYDDDLREFEEKVSQEEEESLATWVTGTLGKSVKSIVEEWERQPEEERIGERRKVKPRKAPRREEEMEIEEEEERASGKGKTRRKSKEEAESEEEEPIKKKRKAKEKPKGEVASRVKGKQVIKKLKIEEKLNEIAKAIHKAAGGSSSKSTTGVGRLSDDTLVVATQVGLGAVQAAAKEYGIPADRVMKTYGAGYHTEVSLYITYGDELVAVGASQGFCPDCQLFLKAKHIAMEGSMRETLDQVWYCPEFYPDAAHEKNPINAPYPYALEKDAAVTNSQVEYRTKAEYDFVHTEQRKEAGKIKRTPAQEFLEKYRKAQKKK